MFPGPGQVGEDQCLSQPRRGGAQAPGTGLLSRVRRGIVTKEAAGRAVTLK